MSSYKIKREKNKIIPLDVVRNLYDYAPSGNLINKTSRHRSPKGSIAGRSVNGYMAVIIEGVSYYNHRIIWAMLNGEQPKEIDHINGNKSDNRIENLRSVSRRQNAINSERSGWRIE